MSKVLTIANFTKELTDPGYWVQERLWVLDAIYSISDKANRVIQKKDLTRIAKYLREKGVLKSPYASLIKSEIQWLNDIILRLQDIGWACTFFIVPIKKSRPSILPNTKRELDALVFSDNLSDVFWNRWVHETPDKTKILGCLALEVARTYGYDKRRIFTIINQLLDTAIDSSSVTFSPFSVDEALVYELPLSNRIRALLLIIQKHNYTSTDPKSILTMLRDCCRTHVSNNDDQYSYDRVAVSSPISILASTNSFMALSGMENILVTQLSGVHLPVPPPKNIDAFLFTHRNTVEGVWPDIIQREKPKHDALDFSPIKAPLLMSNDVSLQREVDIEALDKIDWLIEQKMALRRLTKWLRDLLRDETTGRYQNGRINPVQSQEVFSLVKPQLIEAVKAGITRYITQTEEKAHLLSVVENLALKVSVLDVAINWGRYQLEVKGNTLDTLLAFYSSIFTNGFLDYPGSVDLENWDEEDSEILVNDHLIARRLQKTTVDGIFGQLAQVIAFARKDMGLFQGVYFPMPAGGGYTVTHRNNILGAQEFDLIIKKMINSHDAHSEKLAAVCCLAFYGGMRSGEITNLKLLDVVHNQCEIVLYLPAFKTPSGRRAIHLHKLAPGWVCQLIRDVVDLRRINYRKYCRKVTKAKGQLPMNKVPLFSLSGEVGSFTADQVVSQARASLQEYAGEGADLHLLRHSFATHLFLRWYCLLHPDLIETLLEREHWFYTDEATEALKEYLCIYSGSNPHVDSTSAMSHLIKMMGHSNTSTLFQVYVHSFEVVINHAVARLISKQPEVLLTGKAIANMLPGMASRTSQAKIKDRSIAGVLEYYVNQGESVERSR